ncbi:hypothetical protein TNCV_4596761 [Trichonephila clavipes]|uniref:Uncharacterized protein n=1 Tax=Trichonephila clavipes TaxID=2585209 RepID=A0A8X6WF96_TRICX|nr:hypothetical protein TNCV_4596761 [Trichonephila clavipes]
MPAKIPGQILRKRILFRLSNMEEKAYCLEACIGSLSAAVQRNQTNGSHCEAMVVLTCPKPILKIILVPRPKQNTAFVGFTRVNNQGERNTSKEMLKSVIVEEWNKISTDETTNLNPCQIC